jgi:Phage tail tube protein, GTA-gp10
VAKPAKTLPTTKLFFGDAERTFALTPVLIDELERVCGAGIGAVAKRLFSGQFKHGDMLQTIRLALVGGGETPQVAASLTEIYGAHRPINECLPIAVAILETTFFGKATEAKAEAATNDE